MIKHWTFDQWMMFGCFTVAGLAALALIAVVIRTVRGWTAPARPDVLRTPTPNELHRALVWKHAPAGAIEADYTQPLIAGPVAQPLPVVLGAEDREVIVSGFWDTPTQAEPPVVVDPTAELIDIAEHLAPGPGSLTTLAEAGEGSVIRITRDDLIDPTVAKWFDESFGRIVADFRTAVEPAMRTARLWEIQGRGHHGVLGAARAGLDHWRMECPTGEWPIVRPAVGGMLQEVTISGFWDAP